MGPLKFNPTYISPVWGGMRIPQIRGIAGADAEHNCAEAFDITAHPDIETSIATGPLTGMKLSEAIARHHDEIVGDLPDSEVIQITWMDPIESLSVQVHPDEEYAQQVEGDHGKPEAWYIAAAEPGATIIGGSTTTDLDKLRTAAADDTIGDMYCKRIAVQKGDFIMVPAGTMHALGAGCFAVEVSSFGFKTYRLCDWGRGRELHVDKAFDVLDPASTPTVNRLGGFDPKRGTQAQRGVSCRQFVSNVVDVDESWSARTDGRYQIVTCVSGNGRIVTDDGELTLAYTESALIPACCVSYTVIGPCRVLRSYRPSSDQ